MFRFEVSFTMYERIPEELTAVCQWHVWRLCDDVKVPFQVNGEAAKSNDSRTWTEFQTASDAAQFYSGLAFEITDPWTGVDLDDCIDENGLKSWAIEILFRFDGVGFAEVSPSGTGIKILTRGRKPKDSRCLHKFNDGKVECYDSKRFWTITGDLYNGQDEIKDGQDAINWLCEKYLSNTKKQEPQPKQQEQKTPVTPAIYLPSVQPRNSLMKRAVSYVATVPGEVKGNLRNAAFSLSGHLHSIVGENRERLTDSEVLELLTDWNQRNNPPLKPNELQEAAVNGRKNGTPREDKAPQPMPVRDYPDVDLSGILGEERTEDFDDEEFCLNAVPQSGLLREIFDYYCLISHRVSHVMGLAVAVSLVETICGRRISSHTDLRTNDYNVIIAPTGAGKESCEKTIEKILYAADGCKVPMLPPDVQSGNGLLKAVASIPCGIWVCDEFGKVLESILDRKSNNGHAKQIGTHLLKLYNKAGGVYGGAAHADGRRNEINQPHLCLMGLTTGQIFESLDSRQIKDGLFGRLAFWPVQNRPKRKNARIVHVPESLAVSVRQWLHWEPSGLNPNDCRPEILEMSPDALERWEKHSNAIDEKMERESESRGAIWIRVAARAMKLAIVHRAARLLDDPGKTDWIFHRIELQDVQWAILVANWLARVSCGLIKENVVDTQAARARDILQRAVCELGDVPREDLMRTFRSVSASEFTAAAEDLQKVGVLMIVETPTRGRKRIVYKKSESQPV